MGNYKKVRAKHPILPSDYSNALFIHDDARSESKSPRPRLAKPASRRSAPAQQLTIFAGSVTDAAACIEPKGAVYTKSWVVDLILDLSGYKASANLVDRLAVEPAAGQGAFVLPMATRLIESCRRQGRPLTDCRDSLLAFELHKESANLARAALIDLLVRLKLDEEVAEGLVRGWLRTGDFLFDVFGLPQAAFVIGNPPYVRLEDIPESTAALYRRMYPTMRGRADLYIAFFEAALRQLADDGVCAFICADRWMLNQYGSELRRLVTSSFAVDSVIEMHGADAFDEDVSAYPAVTVIRRAKQESAVVASVVHRAEPVDGSALADSLIGLRSNPNAPQPAGMSCAVVDNWFSGDGPWPCGSPARLALLRRLEDRFEPLEPAEGHTRVGIGVATGLDEVFVIKDGLNIESSRLLPLALAHDTLSGHLRWSGHFLVNPWIPEGLVDLADYPLLHSYFERHAAKIRKRNTAERNPDGWFRTIDRVDPELTGRWKLYIPDIKNELNPVLDRGETYPHHNLYYVESERWDLEVLGGILMSAIGQFFVECYGVRMRGGYLRFQAQYLRRIRVPKPESVPDELKLLLVTAFRRRDRKLADRAAFEIYQISPEEIERSLGY